MKNEFAFDTLTALQMFNANVQTLADLMQTILPDCGDTKVDLLTINRLGALARSIERLTIDIDTKCDLLWNKFVYPLNSVKGGA